jgi:hypothetical protein
MPTSKFWSAILALSLVTAVIALRGSAQETAAPKAVSTQQAQTPPHTYRLDYVLAELEDGKKIDGRQYSFNLGGENSPAGRPWIGRIQIGTRVPVGTKADGTTQYLDVGTTITASVSTRDGAGELDTSCDVTSVAPDEAKIDGRPILRTLAIMGHTPIVEGKPMLVGIADDPNSKREFQLEVTVTQQK